MIYSSTYFRVLIGGLLGGVLLTIFLARCTPIPVSAPATIVHEPLPTVTAPTCASGTWCYSEFIRPMVTDTMISADMSICSGYKTMSINQKRDAWVNLVRAISYAESNWKFGSIYEEAFIDSGTGKKALSVGMLQLSVGDRGNYKTPYCQKLTPDKLTDAETNLGCGLEIMNVLISRNRDIYNLGKYWSVMRRDNRRHGAVLAKFKCQ